MADRARRNPPLAETSVAMLERLYAELPALACLGLCGASCAGHVDASDVERRRIAARGVDLDAQTRDGSCPALTRTALGTDRCRVHDVRPMICRLWGTAAALPCPHGCQPDGGPVDDPRAMRWLLASLQVGGHRDAHVGEVLESALADPAAAALFGRMIRGDRTAAPALAARLQETL